MDNNLSINNHPKMAVSCELVTFEENWVVVGVTELVLLPEEVYVFVPVDGLGMIPWLFVER